MSKNRRILLVDQDPLLRKLRAEVLRRNGYHVFPALNLSDARSRCKPGRYVAVLVSSHNEAEALEFCESIRSADPDQLVIVMTHPHAYLPEDSCPDEVIQNSDPEEVLERVNAAIAGP